MFHTELGATVLFLKKKKTFLLVCLSDVFMLRQNQTICFLNFLSFYFKVYSCKISHLQTRV